MTMRYLPLRLAAAAGLAAALVAAAPAFAQNLDEVTVSAGAPADDLDVITSTAHALRAQPQSISEKVSYAGLDLTSPHDREVLLTRVNMAAGLICDQLDEAPPSAANLGRSCQEIAVRGAMGQIHLAYADARSSADAAGANGQLASARVNDTSASGN